jgi:CubicO group peptidase (beta-lactamase class C family)
MTSRLTVIGLLVAVAAAPRPALAKATLVVIQGGGEFQTQEHAITVAEARALRMVWSTDQAGATGGDWRVTRADGTNRPEIVAQGKTTPAPAPGHVAWFTIAATAFLKAVPPPSPVTYRITLTPLDAGGNPLGVPSPAVEVTQAKWTPGPGVAFGRSMVFPDLELVQYREQIGVVKLTQIQFAVATVKVRAVNNSAKSTTDPLRLSITDFNVLMRQQTPPAEIGRLKPGASKVVTLKLNAILPPPESQLPGEKQHAQWRESYANRGGVDLRAVMDWRGPQADAPVNDHRQVSLYKGLGDSTPCQEGKPGEAGSPADSLVCDGDLCVSLGAAARELHQRLDCRVVGYSFFIGRSDRFGQFGKARTAADGPARDFTSSTKMPVASVSKLVTTLAALRVLQKNNVPLNSAIDRFLPSDWKADSTVKNITFEQLLSHTSGVMDYGNNAQDDATLKKFFTQKVNVNSRTTCKGSDVVDPKDAIVVAVPPATRPERCYSNYNFSLFRILLPMVDGFVEGDPASRPARLAARYVKLVQEHVFDSVGAKSVACKPPSEGPGASGYAFSYKFPGKNPGHDWGDSSLGCGGAGWYLSVEDLAKVLISLNKGDGKVLSPAQFTEMETRVLGWDKLSTGVYRYLEKNGGWGWGDTSISTSVAFLGPASGRAIIGVLFLDSDIGREPKASAETVLRQALVRAIRPK